LFGEVEHVHDHKELKPRMNTDGHG
jgi:hypothetical protein